jgi:4-hydroxymandelate oxidase
VSGGPAALNVHDYERAAAERLGRAAHAYFAGAAGDEWTLGENRAAFGRWVLRPRMLVDVSSVSTATSVLGVEASMPVLVGPTAFQRLAHAEGELATARAAAAAGTVMCLSTLSSVRPGALAATGGPRWLQLYWSNDRGFTRALLDEACESGFSAVLLTVDLPVAGPRERDLRTDFVIPDDLPLPNVAPTLGRPLDSTTRLGDVVDKALTWRDLDWLREACPLPLGIKGILTAEDAVLAAEHGADGVVVSNHGGRQLDGVPASLDALPEVVDAVAGRCEVLMDGGVRRGTDVLKALALGARAVLVGRPVIWGLAVGGETGARHVLELLRAELEIALTLLGCPTPAHVGRPHVARAA